MSHAAAQAPLFGLCQAAGVHDMAEAQVIAAAGFQLLGIPLRLPVHQPDLSEAEAAALIASLPGELTPVCITYETDADALLQLLADLDTLWVQLHASLGVEQDANLLQELKRRRPGLRIIKSCVVGAAPMEELEARVRACAPHVDAFITDTFDPGTGACGATGKVHDWAASRRLRELSPRPLLLAGGLTPDNVAAAIAAVHPAGVDAHTGLEGPDGRKDKRLLREFVTRAQQAFQEIGG